MRVTKNQFLKWFAITVAVLAMVRLFFPSIAADRSQSSDDASIDTVTVKAVLDSIRVNSIVSAVFPKSSQTENRPHTTADTLLAKKLVDTLLVKAPTDTSIVSSKSKSLIEIIYEMTSKKVQLPPANPHPAHIATKYTDSKGNPLKNPIFGVRSYKEVFPD